MGRTPLWRRVNYVPSITYFKPAGIPLRELEEVCLSIEELEAIRLKDIEDLEQEQCAQKMNISRPTFVRVLDSARKKVADALIKGKAIKIEGGNYEVAMQVYDQYSAGGQVQALARGKGQCKRNSGGGKKG